MLQKRILAIVILFLGLLVGYFVYGSEHRYVAHVQTPHWFSKFPFKQGLDLSGGVHLIYRADVSKIDSKEVTDAMASLRDVIERRVNLFGVAEPVVQVEHPGFANQGEERLIVDLPGVTDITKAVAMIGQTPLLEFRTENPKWKPSTSASFTIDDLRKNGGKIPIDTSSFDPFDPNSQYIQTELSGRYLKHAQLVFDQNTHAPIISLHFDATGSKLFEDITRANVGKTVAIFLDGSPISTPVVQEAIAGGQAQITGRFTPTEAKTLVGRLNSGALPVPIELISTQTIGPSLGVAATNAGVKAGMIGFLVVALFLLFWYRLPGLIAVFALSIYVSIMLALFKWIPVTLTAAGIAGFVISIGIAVDANVLIFERMKEEIRRNNRSLHDAMHAGFARAWLSIRDSNTSSIITALILFWFGSSLIKGFALTFGLGVLVSLFSAITITRLFLYALDIRKTTSVSSFLFGSGFSNAKAKD